VYIKETKVDNRQLQTSPSTSGLSTKNGFPLCSCSRTNARMSSSKLSDDTPDPVATAVAFSHFSNRQDRSGKSGCLQNKHTCSIQWQTTRTASTKFPTQRSIIIREHHQSA